MIYQVESRTEGCSSRTIHISSNIERAYEVLTDPAQECDSRMLTALSLEEGEELMYFYHSWSRAALPLTEIKEKLKNGGYYNVQVDFSGYIRGTCTHKVKADSEEEAIDKAPRYINWETANIIRDDTSIDDVSIY